MRTGYGREREVLAVSLVCLLAAGAPAFGLNPALDMSQYNHTAWRVSDGFFRRGITAIAQTPDGYLWLGTADGLLRFDGVRSVAWQFRPDESLPSKDINSLVVTRDGTLWIGTGSGLASWKNRTLTQYPALAGRRVGNIYEDRKGALWLTVFSSPSWTACVVVNGDVQCHGEDGGPGAGASSVYEDRQGNLWMGTNKGLWRMRPGPPRLYPLSPTFDGIQALFEDAEEGLLFADVGGIRRLVGEHVEVAYELSSSRLGRVPKNVLRDRDGGLWFDSASGLAHVHHGVTDMFTRADGLSADSVLSLFEDREGNVWVATPGGLHRFREPVVAAFSSAQGGWPSRITSVLAARDGSVWFGTFDGLTRWDNRTATVYRRPRPTAPHDGRESRTVHQVPVGDWAAGALASILEDSAGRVWLSTQTGVGYLEQDRLVRVSGLPGGIIRAIGEDRDGNLWFANQNLGLFQVAPGSHAIRRFQWRDLNHTDSASAMSVDAPAGGVWLGFVRGGISYVRDGRVQATYTASDGLATGRVRYLLLDDRGSLWVAADGGLSRVKDGRVATLTARNGLPCDAIQWVVEDGTQSLWLGTVCGLTRLTLEEIDGWWATVGDATTSGRHVLSTTVFDSVDGFRITTGNPYTAPAVKARDGKVWFVHEDGAGVIDPQRLPFNRLPPPVVVEQITANRTVYQPHADGSRVSLPPLIRDLQIDYTALSLVAPEKMQFRYRLEGRDSDWQDVGTRRQAFYTDLQPATYRFRVIASNNSGVWNEAGAFLDFTIAPAYYQTSWFRLTVIVIILGIVVAAYQWRLRQLAHAFNMRLDERVNERTRIARELHDTLLQSFQGLMLRFQSARDLLPANPGKAVEALDGALDRADQAIVEGRDAIQNLRSSASVTNELAQALTSLAEDLSCGADGEKSSATFRISVEGSPRDLHPIVRDDIHRIAAEALRNAFCHAQAARIEAEITYSAREVRLRIRDDGKGIGTKHLSGGRARHWGLAGMRERAEQIGARLNLWSEVGAGTEVELRIPASVAYGAPRGRVNAFRLGAKRRGG